LADLPSLIENYGEPEYDGNTLIEKTLACGWDDSSHSKLRALRFPETVSLTELTDGRFAYTALWTNALLTAVESGLFPDVLELTAEQLQELLPQAEEFLTDNTITQE
jgi:hypothetical protein